MEQKKDNNWGPPEPLCISVATAAKMIGVSRNTGYLMARLGQLPTIRCGRRKLVVPVDALIKILQGVNERHEER